MSTASFSGPFSKAMVLKIFEAFSIERWNDLVRSFDVVEMDKAAQTAVLSYVLGKLEEDRGNPVDWDRIIYGLFYELLRKIALSDIKSPVQRMLRTEYPHEYSKLNQWIVQGYEPLLQNEKLLQGLALYLRTPDEYNDTTWKVMRAAHKYAAIRELEMIAPVNESFRIESIHRQLTAELSVFAGLTGISEIYGHGKLYQFITKLEQLRFQTRWNQTPRVPRTSVLGHSFYVACIVLIMGESLDFCATRRYNNFFSALFHDLPEAVTRDIISPVKQATDHLSAIVKRIEDRVVEKELLPLMHDCYRDELVYFTSNEFENRITNGEGRTVFVPFNDLQSTFNDSVHKPVDGRLIRAADHVAAFVEADSSIAHGITSPHLRDGRNNILSMYPRGTIVNGHDIGGFFSMF